MVPFFASILFAVSGVLQAPQVSPPSFDKPCSFMTAAEAATALGTAVDGATDEHFRCKYGVGGGWLETKLLDISLKATRDIFDYDKAHGKAVPGLGDQAFVLGATLVAKVGDVVVVVDGSNVPHAPDTAKLKSIAARIVSRIP